MICCCAFNILSGSVYNIATGAFSLPDQIVLSIVDIFLIAYFATSRRVRAQLDRPFSLEAARADREREAGFFRPRTWAFWRNLIMFYTWVVYPAAERALDRIRPQSLDRIAALIVAGFVVLCAVKFLPA